MAVPPYTEPDVAGRIIHWNLEETGQPYETEILAYGPEGMKSPRYLAINPMGKVPAIKHRDVVVTEAAAISPITRTRFRKRTSRPRRTIRCAGLIAGCSSPPLVQPALPEQRARLRDPARQASRGRLTVRSPDVAALKQAITKVPICSATASPPPISMSARRSAGACNSATSRRRRRSRRISADCCTVRPSSVPARSTMR